MSSPDRPAGSVVGTAPRPAHASLLAGGTALMVAKIVFVLAGYAIYAGLSRLLSPSDFGIFLVVNSTVAVLNAVFVTGTIQAVSRFVAMSPESSGGTLRSALRLQLILAGAVGAIYLLAAPAIAAGLGDRSLTPYLRVSAVIPVAYAFYAAFIGYANGRRRFGAQAGFDVAFSGLKILMVVGLPWLGFGVFGAVAGFSTASVLVLLGAWLLIGRQALSADTMAGRTPVEILRFEIFVIGHVAVTNLLMQADLLMVKALYTVGDSNAAAGLYGSAAKLAQIPHSLLVALNFLIFPFIARATAAESISQARGYVREALRIGVALTAGPAIVLASIAAGALALVFGPAYTAAAPTLAILAGAYIAFSLLTMATTIMNSAGKPGVSLAITAGALVMQFGAARQLIAADGLEGVATASASAYLVGLAAGIAYLVTRFGNIVPWSTIGRVAVAAGVVTFANRFCGDLPAPVAAVILGAVYLVTLVALREWTVEDIQVVTGSRGQSS